MSCGNPFFHYTSEWGLRGIVKSGYIWQSSDNHTHFGKGAYGTSLSPEAGQRRIAHNNWESYGHFYIANGKVAIAIELNIPTGKYRRAKVKGRDILVHDGPIYLNEYKWKKWRVPAEEDAYCSESDDEGDDGYDDDGDDESENSDAEYDDEEGEAENSDEEYDDDEGNTENDEDECEDDEEIENSDGECEDDDDTAENDDEDYEDDTENDDEEYDEDETAEYDEDDDVETGSEHDDDDDDDDDDADHSEDDDEYSEGEDYDDDGDQNKDDDDQSGDDDDDGEDDNDDDVQSEREEDYEERDLYGLNLPIIATQKQTRKMFRTMTMTPITTMMTNVDITSRMKLTMKMMIIDMYC